MRSGWRARLSRWCARRRRRRRRAEGHRQRIDQHSGPAVARGGDGRADLGRRQATPSWSSTSGAMTCATSGWWRTDARRRRPRRAGRRLRSGGRPAARRAPPDHLVGGSKEARIAAWRCGDPHVLVPGTRLSTLGGSAPRRLGLEAWPDVARCALEGSFVPSARHNGRGFWPRLRNQVSFLRRPPSRAGRCGRAADRLRQRVSQSEGA